jgi:UrcA family protein
MTIRYSNLRCALATVALLAISTQLAAAPGKPAWDEPHTVVRFGDLDLTQEKDVAKLYSRIRRAARFVCGDHASYVGRFGDWLRCYNETIEDTVQQINRPTLTAFHHSKARPSSG